MGKSWMHEANRSCVRSTETYRQSGSAFQRTCWTTPSSKPLESWTGRPVNFRWTSLKPVICTMVILPISVLMRCSARRVCCNTWPTRQGW